MRDERGFTLLELLVVAAILMVLTAIVAPQLRLRQADLDEARATLQSLTRLLRAEASASGKLHRLRIDPARGQCLPEVLDEQSKKFVPLDDDLARPQSLPVDRLVEVVTPAGTAPGFVIYPGGFVEPALVEVEVDGAPYTLAVHALTGRVQARPGRARQS